MHIYLAAATANCNSGSWSQKWNCGWHQPTTAASNAGFTFGHSIVPWLIVAAVVLLVARARGRSAARSASPKPARR